MGERKGKKEKKKKPGTMTIPLILDGEIQSESLDKINQTNLWLRQQLRKRGYFDIKDISFCSWENGEFYIDLKHEKS